MTGKTDIVQNDQLIGPAALVAADGEENAVPRQSGNQLLKEQGQQDAADDGQVEVVDLEQAVELQRFATLHEFSSTKDDNVV